MSDPGNVDDENNAESFDEDLLVEEGADDTDISGQFPSDHYAAVFDPSMTPDGDARVETIQERVMHEEADPVVEELDRNALAEQVEREAFDHRRANNQQASIDALLAQVDDVYRDEPATSRTDKNELA